MYYILILINKTILQLVPLHTDITISTIENKRCRCRFLYCELFIVSYYFYTKIYFFIYSLLFLLDLCLIYLVFLLFYLIYSQCIRHPAYVVVYIYSIIKNI